MNDDIRKRFFKKIELIPFHECWEWIGSIDKYGYGRLSAKINEHHKRIKAHRISYEIHYGKIPKKLLICHKCDNRSCVRPDHLFAGTHLDNNSDAKRKGRTKHPNKTHWGIDNPKAKINDEIVKEIRSLPSNGISSAALAKKYGITRKQMWNIFTRKNWSHVF